MTPESIDDNKILKEHLLLALKKNSHEVEKLVHDRPNIPQNDTRCRIKRNAITDIAERGGTESKRSFVDQLLTLGRSQNSCQI